MESCSQGTRSKCAFPPHEKTQEVLQKYAGDDTKKCNAPVQKNVPPHTENCRTNTYITTENTDIESINLIHQSDSEDNREKRDNDMMDVMDEANAYMEIIKENIEYEYHMKYDSFQDRDLFEELFGVICDVVCVRRKSVKVNGEDYPYELVKSKFLKLGSGHLEYAIDLEKHKNKTVIPV